MRIATLTRDLESRVFPGYGINQSLPVHSVFNDKQQWDLFKGIVFCHVVKKMEMCSTKNPPGQNDTNSRNNDTQRLASVGIQLHLCFITGFFAEWFEAFIYPSRVLTLDFDRPYLWTVFFYVRRTLVDKCSGLSITWWV